MRVHGTSPLRPDTGGAATVEAEGGTLAGLLDDLERRFPGIRFRKIDGHERVRRQAALFVGTEQTEDLSRSLEGAREVHLVCALSGG